MYLHFQKDLYSERDENTKKREDDRIYRTEEKFNFVYVKGFRKYQLQFKNFLSLPDCQFNSHKGGLNRYTHVKRW